MIVRSKNYIIRVSFLVIFTFIYTGWTLNAQHHEDDQHESESTEQTDHDSGEHELTVVEHGSEHGSGENAHAEEGNVTEVIMDHIKDSHELHYWTTKEGEHASLPLPVILYSKHSGLQVFMSKKIAHHHNYKGFQYGDGMTMTKPGKEGKEDKIVALDGKIVEVDESGHLVEAGLPLDFSITKNVFMMFIAFCLLLAFFLTLARSYKKTGIAAPKGIQGFLEPLVIFVEEDIAIPNIGEKKYRKFMPYLLTVFFFILSLNLLGLIPIPPFGSNVTGNIAVTMVLALFTMVLTNFNGNKAYWKHIFAPPGVPLWLYPIMIPVELMGIITKPFALMIRLFANITAGHIIILSLVSLVFIFEKLWMGGPSGLLVIFMSCIELLVAFLQAYIFTLLSALFIGLAMPEHHHE